MRLWLFALLTLLTSHASLRGQSDFPDSSPVRISIRETLKDVVLKEPFSDPVEPEYRLGTERTIRIEGLAPLTGFDTTELTDYSPLLIRVGNFEWVGLLGDAEDFTPGSQGTINIPFTSESDSTGDEVQIGSISLTWTTGTVRFIVSFTNVGDAFTPIDDGIDAESYRDAPTNPYVIDSQDIQAAFEFGPFRFENRVIFTTGIASGAPDPSDRIPDTLWNVTMEGAIDYLAPTINILHPVPNESTSLGQYTITGTVQDKREIQRAAASTLTFDGSVYSVEVRLSTNQLEGDFVEAEMLSDTDWRLANVDLAAGVNYITVRATDSEGNVTTTSPRKLTFLQRGSITVEAVAKDFADGNGSAAGSVAADFLTVNPKKITALIGSPKVSNTRQNVDSGQMYTVKATPAPGAVFNGWKATLNGADYFTAVNETLVFETKPSLVLTAEFVPNPFSPVLGTYHGLISGDDAKERGPFKIVIAKSGAFTGKAQFGAVTLPLKGKILGSGRWSQTITKSGKTYVINWIVDLAPSGDKLLSGTITSTGLAADIQADLKDWHKAKGSDPGKLATAFAGSYNVFIAPPASPTSDVPMGIGFGRVTISPLGAVSFAGQLGDGTKVSAASTLAQRASGPVVFPLFIALDKKLGNISGYVTHAVQPGSDLTADLTWEEPVTKSVEPQAFEEVVSLTGSRYTKPAAGSLAMLQAASGNGVLSLVSPGYDVPANPVGLPFDVSETATLDALTHVLSIGNTEGLNVRMKISPNTGLFTGGFKDLTLNRVITFAGVVNQKADGGNGVAKGVFVRGNRAGSVTFGLP